MDLPKNINIPKHIGIIMDGNGRWAKKRLMPRNYGHKVGAKVFKKIVEYARDIGVEYITVYAFSTENWKRSESEVKGILNLLKSYLIDSFNYEGKKIKVNFIGDISKLNKDIVDLINNIETVSKKENYQTTLNIAFNYGGRNEIVNATKNIVKDVLENNLDLNDIDEEKFSSYLYTKDQPDPDFILRPSGEFRISNFLIWQSAYSELIFMDVLWPDFTEKDLNLAILEYNKRNRRFGG